MGSRGNLAGVAAGFALESLEERRLLAYSTTVDLQFNAAAGGINGTGFPAVLATTRGRGLVSANVGVASGALRLTSTAGDLTNNNQDDVLNVPANGAADFQVETRLTSWGFTRNYQYAGLFMGTNEDNYLNLITGYVGQPVIEFAAENAKAFSIPVWKGISPVGIKTLDLRLTGTAATKQVKAEYRINAATTTAAWTVLGTVSAPQVFSTAARAGVVSTNVGSATAVTTTFDGWTLRHSPVVTPPPPPPPPPPTKTPVTVGINLDRIEDFSTISPFIDLATMFRGWGTVGTPWEPSASIPLTKDNYPLADAGNITYANTYPDGIYQVSYAGQADLSFNGLSADFHVTSTANGITTGTLYLAPTSNPGILFLYAKNLDPANPLHDLHIISPDANYAVSDTFRPVFLQKVQPFDGWVRMMDWMRTMGSPVANWADRTLPSRFGWTSESGVPYEVMVKLANTLKKDIWVNVPVRATDDYVHQMARFFRDNLRTDVKLYVEYANELWGFQGGLVDAVYNLGVAKQERQTDKTLWKTDDWGLSAQRTAKRIGQISTIFKQEFGATAWAARTRFMFCGIYVASSWGQIALQYLKDNYGAASNVVSGYAINPYVGVWTHFDPYDVPNLTKDAIFAWANNFLDTSITQWNKENKAVANQFGVFLHAYEGGQAFTAPQGRNNAVKEAAQDDPRMGDFYRRLITNFTQISGGGTFGAYSLAMSYSQEGYFGLMRGITDNGSTKYDAVIGMANLSV